jgi:glycerophosphoryl diester phosphodiesterase
VAPITFAHRGARAQHPENTLPAFRYALEHGARGLETDAWLSGDGQVVLVHDPWVRGARLGVVPRRVPVATTSAADLRGLGVPMLADLYDELGFDYELSIDLKDPLVGERIVELARASGSSDRLWLCSPSRRALRALGEMAPDVHLVHSQTRSRLPTPLERHAADLAGARIETMNMHHSEWTAGLVALFHRFDVKAFAWDTQEVRHLKAMHKIGIDAVYSDHVARMVETIDGKHGEGRPSP